MPTMRKMFWVLAALIMGNLGAADGNGLEIALAGRAAFVRGESPAVLLLAVKNTSGGPLAGLKLVGEFHGQSREVGIGQLEYGGEQQVELPLETRYTVGRYPLRVRVSGRNFRGVEAEFSIGIAPEHDDRMPVVMWNGPSSIKLMKKLGFTHVTERMLMRLPMEEEAFVALHRKNRARLDEMLLAGFYCIDKVSADASMHARFPRRDRAGNVIPRSIEFSNPELLNFMLEVVERSAAVNAAHPAMQGLMVNSELRDNTAPSFATPFEAEAFAKSAGMPVPLEAKAKLAPHYRELPEFPLDRILPDDDPLLRYYDWFWRDGDGFNVLNTMLQKTYKKYARPELWSFHDPAVRCPPLWGNGGEVNYVSNWTYANPEPFRAAVTTDELLALAAGRPGQRVMTMTQLFGKSGELTPFKLENPPEWQAKEKASYFTAAPDSLQEAIWAMLSRPVEGIMFHGAPSIVRMKHTGYKLTNPDGAKVIERMLNSVVAPLGPVLKRLPGVEPLVATYQSFAATVFAGRGSWGRPGWTYDAAVMLQYANVPTAIWHADRAKRDGFGTLKALVLPHCDVLTASELDLLRRFQRDGGIVIGDETLAPGLLPDLTISAIIRDSRGEEIDKSQKKMQELAAYLRKELEKYIVFDVEASADLLATQRRWKSSDYLVVINDRREYGDYLGPWRQTMEKGLPNAGAVSIRRPAGAVYELSRGGAVPFAGAGGVTEVKLDYETNDGRLLLFLDQPIAGIELEAPAAAERGEGFELKLTVSDAAGRAVEALLPLRLSVVDPQGRELDGSGYYCAADGVLVRRINIPLDALPGRWRVKVDERASGLSRETIIEIKP